MTRPWDGLLQDRDRAVIERAGFGRRVGFGDRLAVIVVDVQNFMVGPPPGSPHEYPSACGAPAEAAVDRLALLLERARAAGAPVVYTKLEFRRDGSDIGVYGRKRPLLDTEGWCLEGSEGAAIVQRVAPREPDVVLVKKRPSAFYGTGLAELLAQRQVDTAVVCGGSTSNCVRATAVDAMTHGFRTIVPEDCVFDRIDISHRVALFDLDRQYADVVDSRDVIARLGP
ncbi:MAG TPA: isochorismatase family protein [Capillimicrobium sp.]|nr:isochorismatase family protein [Capillimicrobium sp.]